MNNSESIVARLPYWDRLTDEEKALVADNYMIRHFEKGEMIFRGGYECLGQIYVVRGEVRTCLLSDEGREITLYMMRDGDSCVLSASCVLSQITFETHMIAKQPTDILVINLGIYRRIVEQNIYVKCYMYELATERFSQVMWTMQQILFMGFDRRLASFLISEYERTGSKYIMMTHDQIAEQVNSAREVVARMMKRFISDGLVESGRGSIRLLDLEGLKALL